MTKTFICAYGNCEESLSPPQYTRFKLTVTERRLGTVSERESFCCYEHAWRWLKERDEKLNGRRV